MSELKRYSMQCFQNSHGGYSNPDLAEDGDGDWVRYSDAQAAIAAAVKEKDEEIAKLTKYIEAIRGSHSSVEEMVVEAAQKDRKRAESAEQRIRELEAGLHELRAHHVVNNEKVGRPIERSKTIAIIDALLATQTPKEKPE